MASKMANMNKRQPLTLDEIFFVIVMGIGLNPNVAGFEMSKSISYCFYAIWVCLAFYKASNERLVCDYGIKPLGVRIAAPKIAMVVYSLLLSALGLSDSGLVGGLNQIASFVVPIAAVYLFGSKTIDLIFYSCIISTAFVIPFTVFFYGPECLIAPFRAVFDSRASNPFETSQFTFTASYLCVYYSCLDKNRRPGKIIASLFMCFIGFKRIVLVALMFVMLLNFILIRVAPQSKESIVARSLICIGLGCFAYISLLYSGFIEDLMSTSSINVMGRNYYWQVAVDNSAFNLFYLGQGVNSLQKLLTTYYSYLHVGGVHCDILKMYYELGFIGFALWLYYYLGYIPSWLKRRNAHQTLVAYGLVTMFQFVLFFTDNVDTYLGSQLVYCSIPMIIWIDECRRSCQSSGRYPDNLRLNRFV